MLYRAISSVAAGALIIVMAWWSACVLTENVTVCLDDSFITYIYSRNLADGYGLRYNATDVSPTEGFSSPLHVLITAAAMRMGAEPLAFTRAMGLILLWSIPFALVRAGRWDKNGSGGATLWPAALLLLLILCIPESTWHVATGMETILFAALVAWAFAWSVRTVFSESTLGTGRAVIGVMTCLCLALARPEGVILVCGMLVMIPPARFFAGRNWHPGEVRRFALVATGFAIMFGGYVFWKWSYFGYLLPNPYYTKAHNQIFGSAGNLFPGLSSVVKFLAFRYLPLGALIAFFFWFAKRVPPQRNGGVATRRQWTALIFLIFPSLAIVLLYSQAIHEVAGGFRYEFPLLAPLLGVIAIALTQQRSASRRFWVPMFTVMLACKLAFSQADSRILHFAKSPIANATAWLDYQHEADALAQLGLDLADTELGPDGRIVLSGAGLTPYYSRFTTLDWVGLNHNELSGRKPLSIDEVWRIIESFEPDVVYSILPPATKGIDNRADDPAFNSPSVKRTLKGRASELFKQWNRPRVEEMFYREMQYVRDHCEFGAAYSFNGVWGNDWALFAYVRRNSPHRDVIMEVLSHSQRADRTTNFSPYYVNDPRSHRFAAPGDG